jgi:glycerol-3-phosphate cytidylyltransferase
MNKIALIVGGSNGIGLSISIGLLERGYSKIYILDCVKPEREFDEKVIFVQFNLLDNDYSVLNEFNDINSLIITSGFGRIAPFEEIYEQEMINCFYVNTIAVSRILKHFYLKLLNEDLLCIVMGSIAGFISSPLFAVYGASKAAVCKLIESINIELEKRGSINRILNVSPGSIGGTKFNGQKTTDLDQLKVLADNIIENMNHRKLLYIPDNECIFEKILISYQKDPHTFGLESYEYKQKSGRKNSIRQLKIGYLSGTFDLFHVGHLNILRKAKQYCDFLVVGVHKDALHKGKQTFIPFEERLDIVKNIKYVDKVIPSYTEDMDAYNEIGYDFLFVGSDYEGTDRFKRYEEYFKDKNVEIIYFPYTQGTSSTQLRTVIEQNNSQSNLEVV